MDAPALEVDGAVVERDEALDADEVFPPALLRGVERKAIERDEAGTDASCEVRKGRVLDEGRGRERDGREGREERKEC